MKADYEGQERRAQAWHLDKKIPIMLITVLVFQTLALIIWAVRLEGRVEKAEAANMEIRKTIYEMEARERDSGKLVERVVRVETMLENVQNVVNRIDNVIYTQSKTKRGAP